MKKESLDKTASLAASQAGAFASSQQTAATDAFFQGMDLFRQAAERHHKVPHTISQGNLFEYIEAAKFNADAALKGSTLRAHVTAAEGAPTAAADLFIKNGDQVVREVQAKSSDHSAWLTHSLADSKYNNMQKLVPKGQEDRVRELAQARADTGTLKANEHLDTVKNVTDELSHDGVASGGTSYKESRFATDDPKIYAAANELKFVAKEAGSAGLKGGVTGFVVGGAISVVSNAFALSKGNVTWKEAGQAVMTDAGKSGLRSGATGALGAVVRTGASKAGFAALSKSNVATAIAAGMIDVGVTLYDLVQGDISGEEAMEKVGQTGVSTISSIYAGAAAGALFGPVGMIVGSAAAYLVASQLFQACWSLAEHAKLSDERASQLLVWAEEAAQVMEQQRLEFENRVEETLQVRRSEFTNLFVNIDVGMVTKDPSVTTRALTELVSMFGQKLQFASFEEFDRFMLESDEPLVL